MNPRWEVQTTYGYYPDGTWGFATYADSVEEAIRKAQEFSADGVPYRVFDHEANQVVWPIASGGPAPTKE